MESVQVKFEHRFFYTTFYPPIKLNPTAEEELLIHLISSGSSYLCLSDTLYTKGPIYLRSWQCAPASKRGWKYTDLECSRTHEQLGRIKSQRGAPCCISCPAKPVLKEDSSTPLCSDGEYI